MRTLTSVLFLAATLALSTCGTSGTAGLPDCYSDSNCEEGQQCKDGSCQSLDCESDGDCRGGMTCDGTSCVAVVNCVNDEGCNDWRCFSGACVECLADGDCGGDLICIASTCRAGCEQDDDCSQPAPICDKLTGVCVECTEDGDCAAGETCLSGSCQPGTGCKSNTDCQAPTALCDTVSGTCVECLSGDDCDLEQECLEGVCTGVGCSSDADCQEPTPKCDLASGLCITWDGCSTDGDCPANLPACDTQSDFPSCVQCTVNDYCANNEEGRTICDLDRRICVQCLTDNDCVNSGGMVNHCLVGEGICVECTRNADCPDYSSCNPETHSCQEGYHPCAECGANLACQPGTKCVEFVGGEKGDTGCLRDCLDGSDCSKGFYCDFVIGRLGSCRPAYDRENGTCQAIRDSLEKTCHDDSSCGMPNLSDGICVAFQDFSRCSIPCQVDNDCPFEWQCYDRPADPSAGRVCGPPQ